ncbi:hypothetical protein MSC49_03390 [Methylosinus sp. C49]|nr:hypothetical protein MSC49_03390 [Methylosinus sp. C49]
MLSALEFIVGPQQNIATVCINPEDDMEVRQREINACIAEVDAGTGVIVFTDMFGGTPSNLALLAMTRAGIEVVAGFNLPMLIKACAARDGMELPDFVAAVEEAGRRYIHVASRIMAETGEKAKDDATSRLDDLREKAVDLLEKSRRDLLTIESLVDMIAGRGAAVPGMGHNNPPDRAVIDPELLNEGVAATEILEEELKAEKPRRRIVELCYSVLKRVRDGIVALVKWLARKADKFLDALIDSTAKAAGAAGAAFVGAEAALGRLGSDFDSLIGLIGRLLHTLP